MRHVFIASVAAASALLATLGSVAVAGDISTTKRPLIRPTDGVRLVQASVAQSGRVPDQTQRALAAAV